MAQSKFWRQYRAAMIAADAVTIVITYILSDFLRCQFRMNTSWPEIIDGQSSVRIHMQVLFFLPFAWPFILRYVGWYDRRWRSWQWILRNAVTSTAVACLLMAGLALLLQRELYPRAQIGFVGLLLPITTIAIRGFTALAARWIGSRQQHHVLIVGTGRNAIRLRRLLRSAALGRPIVAGHLRGPWEQDSSQIETGAILGDIDRLCTILDSQAVDEVIFCAPLEQLSAILPHVRLCEEVGVTAYVQAESMICHSQPELIDFHGIPLITYAPARHSPEMLSIKRMSDLILAIIGICLASPILLLCALAIKLTSSGPILFRQRRSGLNGREFVMYKFRTMEQDAERKQAAIAHLNESQGPVFKIQRDPRVTSIGRILRRWSIDELPQLFNVFLGDMSIVGPRPPIPAEVEKYDRWQRRRLSMRPGLTCLWQIKGRHKLGFDEWMQLDLFYIDNWSLRLDFLIMCRTIATVLGGTGA